MWYPEKGLLESLRLSSCLFTCVSRSGPTALTSNCSRRCSLFRLPTYWRFRVRPALLISRFTPLSPRRTPSSLAAQSMSLWQVTSNYRGVANSMASLRERGASPNFPASTNLAETKSTVSYFFSSQVFFIFYTLLLKDFCGADYKTVYWCLAPSSIPFLTCCVILDNDEILWLVNLLTV